MNENVCMGSVTWTLGAQLVVVIGKDMEHLGGVNVMIFKWIDAYLTPVQF